MSQIQSSDRERGRSGLTPSIRECQDASVVANLETVNSFLNFSSNVAKLIYNFRWNVNAFLCHRWKVFQNSTLFFPPILGFSDKSRRECMTDENSTRPGKPKRTVQEPAQPGSQGNHARASWTHAGCLLFLEPQRTPAPGRSSQATWCNHLEESEVLLPYPQQYQPKLSPPPARELEFGKAQGSPGRLLDSKMRFTSELEVPFRIFWFNISWQCLAGQRNWLGCCLRVCKLSCFLWSSEHGKLSPFQSLDHWDVFVT